MVFPHCYRELRAALLAQFGRGPRRLLRQLIQQFVQQLIRGQFVVEYCDAIAILGAQACAILHQHFAQRRLPAHECQQQRRVALLQFRRIDRILWHALGMTAKFFYKVYINKKDYHFDVGLTK